MVVAFIGRHGNALQDHLMHAAILNKEGVIKYAKLNIVITQYAWDWEGWPHMANMNQMWNVIDC